MALDRRKIRNNCGLRLRVQEVVDQEVLERLRVQLGTRQLVEIENGARGEGRVARCRIACIALRHLSYRGGAPALKRDTSFGQASHQGPEHLAGLDSEHTF